MSNSYFKIEDLSTAEDIENACAKLSLQEKEIDDKLDALLSKQCFLEAKLSSITKALPNLQIVHSDSRQLSEMINFTSTLAENVSAKVRQLDEARSRVSECQQRVHDLLDLQLCSQGVQTALHNEDYEKAAAHVHRFLSMDQLLLKQTADDVSEDGSSVATSLGLLREAATQLRGVVTEKFDEAVRAEDLASVERFFKLFPLLGMHDQGIEKFTDYLCSKLEETARKNLRVAQECKETDKRANIIYADTLTLLFEGIARVIEIHQPLIETYYGPGRLLSVARRLQRECDRQARPVLTDFGKRRQLTRRVQAVSECLRRPTTAPPAADPNTLDPLMGEITVMHARADLYLRFLRRRITADAEVAGNSEACVAEMETLLSGCELSHRMQELLGSYLLLERYYMEQSVRKAVDLDALDEAGLTSSLVDDVFFILRKCIRRCMGAASLDGTCAVVNDASSVLETELCTVLRAQLKQGYPTGYLDLTQAYNALHSSIQQGRLQASDSDHAKAMFLAYLNNADVSTEFVTSLREQLAEEIPAALTWMSANDRAKLDSCLAGLGATTAGLRTVVELGMQQLRSSAVKPRVAQWIDAFQDTSHQLTEEEFVGLEAHLPFVAGLVGSLDSLLASFKAGLTPANYDTLVGLVAAEVTAHMEKVVFKATFNRMGGLLLDKEVRAVVGYLTAATSWSVRDRFARLSQIATVLSLERCAEITDYCGGGGALTWRLTPSEVRRVMGLRTDFRTEDIRRLKL